MADKVLPGPIQSGSCIREAVCVHTSKIYDSCRDKDCIEDLRLYPTVESQAFIDNAVSVRAKSARILFAAINVDEITFNRGFYTVDVRYFYKVTGEAYTLGGISNEITGLAIFDKRVILFGSEGTAKVFSSDTVISGTGCPGPLRGSLPTAYVETVDPMILNMKLVDICDPLCCACPDVIADVPAFIADCFGGPLFLDNGTRRVYFTLGQFSIIRLERDTHILMPAYDYCLPSKECVGSNADDDPCALFSKIRFPIDEFFPPDTLEFPDGYREAQAALSD